MTHRDYPHVEAGGGCNWSLEATEVCLDATEADNITETRTQGLHCATVRHTMRNLLVRCNFRFAFWGKLFDQVKLLGAAHDFEDTFESL